MTIDNDFWADLPISTAGKIETVPRGMNRPIVTLSFWPQVVHPPHHRDLGRFGSCSRLLREGWPRMPKLFRPVMHALVVLG